MIKSDAWLLREGPKGLIDPFEAQQVRRIEEGPNAGPVISYGVSSYGYDIRVDTAFRILDPARHPGALIDPKNFSTEAFQTISGRECILPPHGLAMAQSLEWFRIPRNVLVICQGKSTYARCGILVQISPLEPEWEGRLTFAISNTTPLPAKIYGGEGIAQILFLESDEVCRRSYADKQGKYQRQAAFTPPKV